MVQVSGQVRSQADDPNGVHTTLQFFSSSLQGTKGLTTSFSPLVTTDGAGRYTTRLFPGLYRVVATPQGANSGLSPSSGARPLRQWAITERLQTITQDSTQVDVVLDPTRIVDGIAVASSGNRTTPALGATLEATPATSRTGLDILRLILEPQASLPSTSVPVNDTDGSFALSLDPGDFDLLLRPAQASNFAWWVWPAARIGTIDFVDQKTTISPRLAYPVPLEGLISVTRNGASEPLRNATVRAYANTPIGAGVAQVGEARTDDNGRYSLR